MATRSMVLTNLLTEQQLRSDIEDRLTDKGGEQQEKGEMNGVQHGRVYTNMYTASQWECCRTQGAHTGA